MELNINPILLEFLSVIRIITTYLLVNFPSWSNEVQISLPQNSQGFSLFLVLLLACHKKVKCTMSSLLFFTAMIV